MNEFIPPILLEDKMLAMMVASLIVGGLFGWLYGHGRYRGIIRNLQQQLSDEKHHYQHRLDSLEQTFNSLSSHALERNNRLFLELAQQSMNTFHARAKGELELKEQSVENLIKPIREALDKTHLQIERLEKDRRETYGTLSKHLESLAQTQQALHGETRNLVAALRKPEVRGQWGELTLRRLAELAGMVEHCDFHEQVHVQGDDKGFRPDMLIHMPAGRQVVVDVKTPLEAYLNAVESTDLKQREEFLTQHARIVRTRVRELASKNYWSQFQDAPEFVILFIPGDQFLSAALDQDRSLLEDALQQKVILATPTSFVALLRAVAYGWRQEALNQNAEIIRKIGEDLYKRLNTLTEHLSRLGRALDSSVSQYNKVVGSFESKVIPGARKFQELGVNSEPTSDSPEPIEKQARLPLDQ